MGKKVKMTGIRRKMKKKFISAILVICMCVCAVVCVFRTDARAVTLEEVRAQRQLLQQQKAENDKQIDSLTQDKKNLQSSLQNLNSKLYNVSNSINELQEDIEEKESEIEQSKEIIALTEQLLDIQYESMKLRIQYMYENGGTEVSILSLLEADSFADFLTKSQYILDIAEADRQLLEDYETTLAELEEEKTQLESEEQELLLAKDQLEQQENSLLSSISGTKTSLANTSNALTANQQASETLAKQIAEMEAYEQQLEAEKAAAAKQAMLSETRVAQIAKQEAELAAGNRTAVAAEGEAELLAALIYCEAGGEGYTAQVAVGTVVINRVCSTYFPNTITSVIYQNKQFSPAMSGKLALVLENGLTTDSCRNAANAVLAGGISGDWLYFCVNEGGINGTVINHQVFY
jgi:peptidoglycan hydrolase CwlO-like protein